MSSGRSFPCTRTRGGLLVVIWRSLPPISIIFFNSSLSVIPAIRHPQFYRTVSQDFFHGRLPARHLDQTAAPQRDHSLLDGLLLQFQCRSADKNELAQFIIDFHHFVQAGTSLIATLAARGATLAMINLCGFCFFRSIARVNQGLDRKSVV